MPNDVGDKDDSEDKAELAARQIYMAMRTPDLPLWPDVAPEIKGRLIALAQEAAVHAVRERAEVVARLRAEAVRGFTAPLNGRRRNGRRRRKQ